MEELRHALSIMTPSYNLGQDDANVDDLYFGALGDIRLLRQGIRHHQFLERALRHALQRVSAQDAVCHEAEDPRRARLGEVVRRETERAACVGHVVHEDRHFVAHLADEHHPRNFVGLLAFFVEEGKVHA